MDNIQQSVWVDKFYEMDPQFEDLLHSGTLLKDGMIVLIEDSMVRENLDVLNRGDLESRYALERAKENNRWCTVSHLELQRRMMYGEYGEPIGEDTPLISFVATYADGTKKKRSYSAHYAWIVKLDSIRQEGEQHGQGQD